MKKNRIALVMVLAVLAASFVTLTFADDSSADDVTTDATTVSTVTTITSGNTLELTDTKFTDNGKYVIESGAVLSLPMALKLTSEKTDATIIEMKQGSSIEVLTNPIYTFVSNTEIELKGDLAYSVAIDLTATSPITVSVDISENGKFGLMGFEITGGKNKEISIGVDSTGSGIDLSMDIPSITYKGEFDSGIMSDDSVAFTVEMTATDLKLSANISGDMTNFTIKGQGSDTSATLSASKISSKVYDKDGLIEMVSSANSPSIGLKGSGSTTGVLVFDINASLNSSEGSWKSAVSEGSSKIEGVKLEASVSIDNTGDSTKVTIGGAGSNYASFSIKSMSCSNRMIEDDDDDAIDFSADISNINLKIKMTAGESGPTNLEILGDFDKIGYKGSLPSDDSVLINQLTANDGKIEISVKEKLDEDMEANIDVSLASFDVVIETDFSDGFKVSGNTLKFSLKNDDGTISADKIKGNVACITERTNNLEFDAAGLIIDLSNENISVSEATADFEYSDGKHGKIVMKNVKSVDNVLNGELTFTDIRDDFQMSVELGPNAVMNVTNAYFLELEIANGAKVNGNIMLSEPGSDVVFADGSELSLDDDSKGVIVDIVIDNSVCKSATLRLQDGYSKIPAHSYGVDYVVSSDGKTATISQGYGDIVVEAESTKYTIRYNNAASQIAIGEKLEIGSAPAEAGYRFVGWFDGVVFTEGTYYYLTMPGDRTLTPVFEPFQKRYSTSGNTYVLDIGTADRIELDYSDLQNAINEMKSKNLSKLEIRNDVASVSIPYSMLVSQYSVSVEIIPVIPQDESVSDVIGSSLAYNIVTSINGFAPQCSLNYKLNDGESIDKLSIRSVNQYGRTGTIESEVKDNGDGTATISFNAPAAKNGSLDGVYVDAQSSPSHSDDSDSGISMTMIAGIVVGVLIVAGIVVLLMKRRSGGSI